MWKKTYLFLLLIYREFIFKQYMYGLLGPAYTGFQLTWSNYLTHVLIHIAFHVGLLKALRLGMGYNYFDAFQRI